VPLEPEAPGPLPSASAPTIDPALQAKARAFASQRRGLTLLEIFLLAIYFVIWATANVGFRVGFLLRALSVPWWLAVLVQAAAFGFPLFLLTLPFRYLGGYVLPRHFGLLVQSRRAWAEDFAKGIALSTAVGIPLILGLYALLRFAPGSWWAWATAGYTLYGIVLAAVLPVLLVPIFYQVRPLGPEHADLARRLTAVAGQARARVRGVFSLELSRRTPAATALLVGLGRTRRVFLTDTLLMNFSSDEIETVFAHELAHHRFRDIPVGIALSALLSLISFRIADVFYRSFATALKLRGLDDPAGMPILLLILPLAFLLGSPISNAYSRWRERRADRYAIRLTRKPEAFAGAMKRFANLNLAVANPSRLSGGSHPSLAARIREAEAFAARMRAEEARGR
jgi:STE24 endopeptidase